MVTDNLKESGWDAKSAKQRLFFNYEKESYNLTRPDHFLSWLFLLISSSFFLTPAVDSPVCPCVYEELCHDF